MASRISSKGQSNPVGTTFEPLDKCSNTLKRHPKMELSKPDLLQLLSVLEGELQAREIVIAVLKAEQVKQLLYPHKKTTTIYDPWSALQRDSFGAFDTTFDEAAVKALYNIQLQQLENLIIQQKRSQGKLREQLRDADDRYEKLVADLEDEKRKHAQDTAQGDDVTYLLEKERERLRQEVEFERQQNRRLEKEVSCLTETIEQERMRQKQIVILLLAERKRLILRLLEERQKNERLTQLLNDEKLRTADMVEGLEEESKKSLQMEAEMERQLCEFEVEREQFRVEMASVETRNHELTLEIQKLHEDLDSVRKQLGSTERMVSASGSSVHLGEGVRSTIVTMVSTPPAIRVVPTVSPTVSPPRGMARAVSPKSGPAPATPAKPPGLIPQIPAKIQTVVPVKPPAPLLATPVVSAGGPPTGGSSSGSAASPPKGPYKSPKISPVSTEDETLSQVSASKDVSKSTLQVTDSSASSVASPETAEKTDLCHLEEHKTVMGTKVFATAQGGKLVVNVSTSPLSAFKKPLPIGRGTPPPIPPNKPVLPPQALHRKDLGPRPPVPPRSDFSVEMGTDHKAQKPVISGSHVGMMSKVSSSSDSAAHTSQPSGERPNREDPQVGLVPDVDATTTATTNDNLPAVEVLGQELADFQQLLVSMASGRCPEVM